MVAQGEEEGEKGEDGEEGDQGERIVRRLPALAPPVRLSI